MAKDTIETETRYLRVGDYLVGSGRTVTAAPSRGAHTPPGKTDVEIDGAFKTWGSYTRMKVWRELDA